MVCRHGSRNRNVIGMSLDTDQLPRIVATNLGGELIEQRRAGRLQLVRALNKQPVSWQIYANHIAVLTNFDARHADRVDSFGQ